MNEMTQNINFREKIGNWTFELFVSSEFVVTPVRVSAAAGFVGTELEPATERFHVGHPNGEDEEDGETEKKGSFSVLASRCFWGAGTSRVVCAAECTKLNTQDSFDKCAVSG